MSEGTTYADDHGRYRLDSRIATGGMGEVWRATDTTLGREVAVKLLKTEYSDDPTFRQRFETEARHAAALHHPGVAAVFDVGERASTDGSGHPRPFLVMELVDGRPLSDLIGAGRDLDPEAVKDLLAQAGDALGAAHRAGIVHRDVKPANLMVTPGGTVKVTDFGIARAADGVQITRTGAVMGTPQYLSPEQAEGRGATAASDVYALGIVAFECLTGHRPFDKESSVATALAHVREPVPALPAGVPGDLAAVVTRALAKDPAERYADGAAFAAALRDPRTAAITRPPVVPAPLPVDDATRTQVLGATPYDPAPVAPVPPTGTTSVEEERRRNPWPIVLVVLLLVALAIVLALLLTGGDDDEPVQERSTRPAPTSSAPPTSQDTGEPEPERVRVNAGELIGRDIDEVESILGDLGLQVDRSPQPNSNPDIEGVVTSVLPSGSVDVGSTIVVEFWDVAPPVPTEEPPTEEPPTEEPPTEEPPTEEPPTEPTETTGPPEPTDGVTP